MIPPPSNVVNVWLVGDETLAVHFPYAKEGKGHTIHFSGDVYGLTCMMQTLRERRARGDETIGKPATPTQWDIDRAIRKLKITTGSEAPPKLNMRKLSRDDRDRLRSAQETERRKERKNEENMAFLKELGLV